VSLPNGTVPFPSIPFPGSPLARFILTCTESKARARAHAFAPSLLNFGFSFVLCWFVVSFPFLPCQRVLISFFVFSPFCALFMCFCEHTCFVRSSSSQCNAMCHWTQSIHELRLLLEPTEGTILPITNDYLQHPPHLIHHSRHMKKQQKKMQPTSMITLTSDSAAAAVELEPELELECMHAHDGITIQQTSA